MYNYSLKAFGSMIGGQNQARVAAYHEAMARVITSESVVLEIGTGIGYFALLACQLGARHVYAIELNPLVRLGEKIAAHNQFGDRITFIQGLSSDITLPEPADLIVSDIRGALPWIIDHIPSIADARTRLLKSNGIQIPLRDTVWAALVDAADIYERRLQPWDNDPFGLDLSAARTMIVNSRWKERVMPSQLVGEPILWDTLSYETISAEKTDAYAALTWPVKHPATTHCLALWFESELTTGVHLSNAPDQPPVPMYGHSLFPFEQPLKLKTGDIVRVSIQAKRMPNNYIWSWSTDVHDAAGVEKNTFQQSTFLSEQSLRLK